MGYISASSQRSIAAQQKIVFADGNLHNAVLQQPYIWRSRGGGGGGGCGGGQCVPPSAPFPLKQLVPISASIYNVFHSVIYTSVV